MINQVHFGDVRELSKQIPDESVDMIFTDPPYHKKHLPLYGWLAHESVRILKPGAWAFIYGGWVGKEVMDLLSIEGWDHFATIALVNTAGYPRWWTKKLMIGYKPVWVFVKWPPNILKWQANLAKSDRADKRYHVWGQGTGFAIQKIDMFTKPGDLVVDFFCGGGQTAEACVTTGRNFITFDNDPVAVEVATNRIMTMERPLFIPEYDQLDLL